VQVDKARALLASTRTNGSRRTVTGKGVQLRLTVAPTDFGAGVVGSIGNPFPHIISDREKLASEHKEKYFNPDSYPKTEHAASSLT
jgi:hypothetical protein